MFRGQQRAVRQSLAAQAALVWGQVGDVGEFIESGRIDPVVEKSAPPITDDVARHIRAQEIAGRFVMPEEVDAWLAKDPAARPNDPSPRADA